MKDYKKLVERLRGVRKYTAGSITNMLAEAADAIEELLPSAEVEPVKRGRWVDEGAACYCSICGRGGQSLGWNYCPWCGAKMEGEENEGPY